MEVSSDVPDPSMARAVAINYCSRIYDESYELVLEIAAVPSAVASRGAEHWREAHLEVPFVLFAGERFVSFFADMARSIDCHIDEIWERDGGYQRHGLTPTDVRSLVEVGDLMRSTKSRYGDFHMVMLERESASGYQHVIREDRVWYS